MSDDAAMERPPFVIDAALGLAAAAAWAALSPFAVSGGLGAADLSRLGLTALELFVFVVVLRRARPLSPALVIAGGGALLALVPLSALAALLIQRTHHRALGAVTFAVGAMALWVAGMTVAWRFSPRRSRRPSLAWLGLLAALLSFVLVTLRVVTAHTLPRGEVRAVLLAMVLAAAAVGVPRRGSARGIR